MSFWKKIFGKNAKDLFLEFDPTGSNWRIVTWNFDLDDPKKRRFTVEIQGRENKTIQWERKDEDDVYFFEDESLVKREKVKNPEMNALMNLTIHSTLKFAVESNHEFMVTPVTGATTQDFQNESRALQWIEASFGTLIRALDSLKKDPNLILTGACFSGIVPDTGERVLRVLVFNLDIFYYLRDDHTLQIAVFDDKNLGHGQSKTPTFQQIIKVTKPQFYDEITKLIHRLAQVGEL